MKISVRKLRRAGACKEQVDLFRRYYGDAVAVEVTLDECMQHASEFDWDWAANNLLPAPSCDAYYEAKASARKAYYQATALAHKAYDEATAPARKAYAEATAPAHEAYVEATALAHKAYYEAKATAFALAAAA